VLLSDPAVAVLRSLPRLARGGWVFPGGARDRQPLAQPAGIECLVADEGQAGDAGHENVNAGYVVTLARQEHEAHQIAKRVDQRGNLGGQAAA
jgi:hypothetical protein